MSCDLNYRKKLWKWGKAATEVMPQVVRNADVLVANEEDCQMALGIQSNADVASGKLDPACYRGLAARVLEAYPRLRYLAVSLRESLVTSSTMPMVKRALGAALASSLYTANTLAGGVSLLPRP